MEDQPMLSSYEEDSVKLTECEYRQRNSKPWNWVLYALLVLSVLGNILLLTSHIQKVAIDNQASTSVLTKYAGLARDTVLAINSSSPYGLGSRSEIERSILWESLDTSTGEISLDTKWAKAQGLPDSQEFFWNKNRSIYLINAYHSVHCLRKVRRWVTISYHNGTQLDSYPHLIHCMDLLLQNTICEADDTPMYTSATQNVTTGMGQQRMCRSWDKLSNWASKQTACFSYINETQGVDAVIQRFRYCPQESGLLEPMRQSFGYKEDWFEERVSEIESMPHYWENFEG
ncbi:hypothetical protein OCU04_006959 [Sclerotinia nivalis]|uniref:Uncharacterized protein n=1 Tax=Sclerotinia nivalis TaxID=352851 RepID=A0A9X0APB9_9HELO|nr:hypothetical protein OCU04_006959 [Sclerotinia nivalis]